MEKQGNETRRVEVYVKNYLKLLRIKHYLKNFLIFLPIIFSGSLFEKEKSLLCLLGFLSFSLVASSVYIINDLRDLEKDRKHPIKCKRQLHREKCRKIMRGNFFL